MKRQSIVCVVLALSLTSGGFAIAQGNSERNDRGRGEQGPRGDNRGDSRGESRGDSRGEQRSDNRRDNEGRGNGNNRGRADNDRRGGERGGGPNHQFYRGDRLPVEYRHRQYVVDDWRGHALSAPPRGYHWVQSGGDYLLVAVATGVILQMMLNN